MTVDELVAAAGGVAALARIAGVDHSTVAYWRRHGNRVPTVERAILISDGLGITRHEIRPDIWPEPDSTAAA